MSFTRKLVALVAPLTLLCGFSVLGASSADARGTTHSIQIRGNQINGANPGSGHAVETKVRLKFSCNSTTGAYTLTVKNFNLIGSDLTRFTEELAPGSHDFIEWVVENVHGTHHGQISVNQNAATELFDGVDTGTVSSQLCATGTFFAADAFDSGDSVEGYSVNGPLS
jgi:hypothetical protein